MRLRPTRTSCATHWGQVAQVNRWLGLTRPLRRHLQPLIARGGQSRILDVGTGNGETLREIARWARTRGCALRCVGVDWSAQMVAIAAQARGATVLQADALRLPFPDGAFDAVDVHV